MDLCACVHARVPPYLLHPAGCHSLPASQSASEPASQPPTHLGLRSPWSTPCRECRNCSASATSAATWRPLHGQFASNMGASTKASQCARQTCSTAHAAMIQQRRKEQRVQGSPRLPACRALTPPPSAASAACRGASGPPAGCLPPSSAWQGASAGPAPADVKAKAGVCTCM